MRIIDWSSDVCSSELDTRHALLRIATAWGRLFQLPVIGVTGSNGKTTTKEMIASILLRSLGEEGSLATKGNLNNDIGVPLTVLRLNDRNLAAVFEQIGRASCQGKSVSVRVDIGGRRIINTKKIKLI